MKATNSIGILGAGTWGLALARLLYRNGHQVTVWSALPQEIDALNATHTHPNLPGMVIPEDIRFTTDDREVCEGKDILLFAVPSVFVRSTAARVRAYVPDGQIIVDVAKGIEPDSLMTLTEVIRDELSKDGQHANVKLVALSGPTHAEEVALDMPTSIVSACTDMQVAETVQDVFMNTCMRTYTNTDVLGVELCGALKNIIALAAGMATGMGFGDNAKAMLITRGMAEISRLGLAMGCAEQTFNGLAGIGDLIVTATSVHSRNNRCGQLIGEGMEPADAVKAVGMVVEGINALPAALQLAQRYHVELPIAAGVDAVVSGKITAADMAMTLMTRDKTREVSQREMNVRFESAVLRSLNQAPLRRTVVWGRFDTLNSQTLQTLRRLKAENGHLTVALQGNDDTRTERQLLLEALRSVDAVIPADTPAELLSVIRAQHATLVCAQDAAALSFLRGSGVDVQGMEG